MDIFPNLPAVRNGVILPAVWSGMRIGTCGSHFIGPHLRGAHQLIVGRQSCDATLRTEGVGASYNILLCSIHIRRRSSRRNSFSGGNVQWLFSRGKMWYTKTDVLPVRHDGQPNFRTEKTR